MDVEKVAGVARLNLEEGEKKKFKKEFDEILDWFSSIDEIDTKDTEPSFHPLGLGDRVREDEIEESLSQKEALENTKHKEKGYFKGPRVV